jgi:hypothetical protein
MRLHVGASFAWSSLACLGFFGVITRSIGADDQGPRNYRPNISQPEFREFTEFAIRNRMVPFRPPWVRYDETEVRYFPGKVSDPTLLDASPLHDLLSEQHRVTLMRIYRSKEAWRHELEQIEAEIARGLNSERYEEIVGSLHGNIDDIYQTRVSGLKRRPTACGAVP